MALLRVHQETGLPLPAAALPRPLPAGEAQPGAAQPGPLPGHRLPGAGPARQVGKQCPQEKQGSGQQLELSSCPWFQYKQNVSEVKGTEAGHGGLLGAGSGAGPDPLGPGGPETCGLTADGTTAAPARYCTALKQSHSCVWMQPFGSGGGLIWVDSATRCERRAL